MLRDYNFLQDRLRGVVKATKKYVNKRFKAKITQDSVFKKSGRGACGARERAYGPHWRKAQKLAH